MSKNQMLNITTGIFHNKMNFEAEFEHGICFSGNFERTTWINSPAEFDEYGFCYEQQDEGQAIELYDLEVMDEDDTNPEVTQDMKDQVIQFIKAQYI